jgi:branched-chain amino acid transport system ATP-binding protein
MRLWRLLVTSLAIRNVSKRFGGVEAVSGLSLETAPGRITGLIGPNGAGKTTIVNLITGMLKVSGGTIEFEGLDITSRSARDIARLGVSRTFQNIRLLKEATVLENVIIGFHRHEKTSIPSNLLGFRTAREERNDFRGRARKLLELFNMVEFGDSQAGALSYGHQRRVEMMRALATFPRLLLLDEPVAGMNDVEAEQLGNIFRRLADQGISILLIEHNMRFVMALCDRVYVVDTGRLISSGTAAEVCNDPNVIQAYLGA